MIKVLIYSSKEIYDNASYEGRAEADIIAYRVDESQYQVLKNRKHTIHFPFDSRRDLEKYGITAKWRLKKHIEQLEAT